jgi:hypothetical protein
MMENNERGCPECPPVKQAPQTNKLDNNTPLSETQAKYCLAVAGRAWWERHKATMLARETARQAGEVSR